MLPGTRLGVYEILVPLGAGGMGEVFRARDTRLQRDVALKLLPAAVATDPDRLARFTREAQVLAALNHPHIGAIHGLEESGRTPALVLELVEGPTLADRLMQGPLEVSEAVGIARQIADALEFAHEHGIVHRDLKPANIKLRPDGTVKVLDFGLAKALTLAGDPSPQSQDLAHSPTFTNPATAAGVIMGTAAYMAPEQARGGIVDRRADIWAFGVVLFEMVTGHRPFAGTSETLGDTMAAILRDEPDWASLPPSAPDKLRRLIRRTLEKDPRRRLRDIGDARLELEDILAGGSDVRTPTVVAARASVLTRVLPWAIAVVSVAAVGWFATHSRPSTTELPTLRYALPIPGLELDRVFLPTLSPDGMRVVYASNGQLWIRDLDKIEPRPLSGTTGAQFPFWSPDSRQIAYLTATALWRAPIDGGPPVRIASVHFSKGGRTPGGVWRRDGTIVFAPAATGSTILTVPADGGEFGELFARDPKEEGDFHKPSLLPDGVSFFVVIDRVDSGADTIAVVSGGAKKVVFQLKGEILESPVYSPTGHLVYHRETTTPGIWAVPFSLERLETTGSPFLVTSRGAWPGVGANGLLVYADLEIAGFEELVWFDLASGAVVPALNEQFAEIVSPRLSPDGTQVAAVVRSAETGSVIITADLRRHTHVQVAERASLASRPAWKDARSIIYAVDAVRGGPDHVMMRRADASEPAVELFQGMQPSVSRTGQLLFVRLLAGQGGGIWHVPLPSGSARFGEPAVLLQTPVHEWEPTLSPNGRLLAYSHGDSGQSQVMLRGYPESSGQWQVSVSGGRLPLWSPTGDKLYFRSDNTQVFVVDVKTTPEITLSAPRLVTRPSSLIARTGFDISADGTRLLMVRPVQTGDGRTPSLTVVQNWFAEFKKPNERAN